MTRTVTLIRHAETNANRAGLWQGSADSGLSPRGEKQLAALAARQNGSRPDVLIASDLPRTRRTASAFGDPVLDPAWREFGVGKWEGLTSDEIKKRYPGELEMFFRGEDAAPGGGEPMPEFRNRILAAFESLIESMRDGQSAVVVTHGGVIWAVMGCVLGLSGGAQRMIPSHNTASTVITVGENGTKQVAVFNDASHLRDVPTQFGPDGPMVSLFRHGQTQANVDGIWQGRTDSPLTVRGREQVEAASQVAPRIGGLFTSPLGRSVETASIIGDAVGLVPETDPGLIEMSFGGWEDMTMSEAAADDPELFERIYDHDEDLPRGGDGESFAQAGARVFATIESIVRDNAAGDIGVVSHGATIRAYIVNVVGLNFAARNRFPIPRNSSMAQVRYTETGPVLAGYNIAPNLDD